MVYETIILLNYKKFAKIKIHFNILINIIKLAAYYIFNLKYIDINLIIYKHLINFSHNFIINFIFMII